MLNEHWTILPGGKYEGKTLPAVVLSDPNYFFYGIGLNYFSSLATEAEKIEIRAQHIIIPNLAGKRQVAVYCADAVDCWRFNSVILVPEGTDLSPLRSVTEQKAVLDLSVTYRHFNSDRTSGPTMIRQMKEMALPRSCRPYDAPSLRGFLYRRIAFRVNRSASIGPTGARLVKRRGVFQRLSSGFASHYLKMIIRPSSFIPAGHVSVEAPQYFQG